MNERNQHLIPSSTPSGKDETEGLSLAKGEDRENWAVIPTGAAEEFGVDSSLPANGNAAVKDYSVEKKRVWQRQEAFLEAYRRCGKIGQSAEVIGLTRYAVVWWTKHDIFGFRERINAAHQDYCENKIEALIDSRLEDPQGNRGSDILLMFRAKGEMPAKYRENALAPGQQKVTVTQIIINAPGGGPGRVLDLARGDQGPPEADQGQG